MKYVFMALLIIIVTVTACTQAPVDVTQNQDAEQQNAETKEVHIDMFDWGFNQDPVTIKKGDHVKLRITSSNGTHGIMIPGLGLSTGRIASGEEQVLEFDATEAGTFEYFCNVPCGEGHKSMRSQIIVEE
ncbi:hypothetical protein C4573_00545 [Candidatus Woesearchaeota archaeon]|nr:MAG: hypothetical protein C4573_00545 [Candidatus Woesearchaeota archaeon]